MRELTISECEMVSGGHTNLCGSACTITELSGITVTGPGGGGGGWYPPLPGGGGGGDGGGGGGGYQDPRPDYDDCDDRASDTKAADINDEINDKPDSNTREYGALLYRDANGDIQRTRLLSGDNWSLTELAGLLPADLGFDSWDQVVGLVHSHPTMNNVGTEANPIWLPSTPESHHDRPSSGDWVNADFYIRNGANEENFTLYISHDGVIKEYDAFDNKTESRDITIPRGGHGAESGDYNPGATCP